MRATIGEKHERGGSSAPSNRNGKRPGAALLLALCLATFALPDLAGAQGRDLVGEEYLNTPPAPAAHNATAAAQRQGPGGPLHTGELLDSASPLWAGAQALRLKLAHDERPLTANAIAGAGDVRAAAAASADGRLHIFGTFACNATHTPQNQPALSLAIAPRGGILAAWAQGVDALIFYELSSPGCASTMTVAPFRGEADIALNAEGTLLAARDAKGNVWLGQRGGDMRVVGSMAGQLALFAFTEGGGALVAVREDGQGAVWNGRSGARLITLRIPEGPYTNGALQGGDVLLRRYNGETLLWDLTGNARETATDQTAQEDNGWTELRGDSLFLVSMRKTWQARPIFHNILPLLEWSPKNNSLRLRDVDRQVRYYDAKTGRTSSQVFAEDWTAIPIDANGAAHVGGREFRIYDTLAGTGGADSRIYCRAVSREWVMLWADRRQEGEIRIDVKAKTTATTLRKAAQEPLIVPYRDGLDEAATELLRIK
jgi:hypothetical protein